MTAQFSKEFEKEMIKEINKTLSLKGVTALSPTDVANTVSNTVSNQGGIYTVTVGNTWGLVCGHTDTSKDFIPTKVIFNAPATICFFPDGSKIIVKCASDEEFVEEEGVMACIVKKIFKSRNAFKKLVREAYRQPKNETEENTEQEIVTIESQNTVQGSVSSLENDGNITLSVKE